MAEEALTIAHSIVNILDEKKGDDILLLDLLGVCSFTDYFVIATGVSERTIRALSDDVVRTVRKENRLHPRGEEGEPASGWVLIDFGDVIVHLFSEEMRDFYQLEDLWRDGQVLLRVQ